MDLVNYSKKGLDLGIISDCYDLSIILAELSLLIEVEKILVNHSNIRCVRDWMGSVVIETYKNIKNRYYQYGDRNYCENDDDLPLYLSKFFEKYTKVSKSLNRDDNSSLLPSEEITRDNIESLKIISVKKIESYYRQLDNKMWVLGIRL